MNTFIVILVIGFVASVLVKGKGKKDHRPKKTGRSIKDKNNTPKKKKAPPVVEAPEYKITPVTDLQYSGEALSKLPNHYTVTGTQGDKYILNLQELSCSCLDFSKNRAHFPKHDVRRICKHQARAIIDLKKNTKITKNSLLQAFVRNHKQPFAGLYFIEILSRGRGPKSFYISVPQNLPHNENKGWINILFPTEKSYEEYGYNYREHRWAHRENPIPDGRKKSYNKMLQNIVESGEITTPDYPAR